MSAVQGHGIPSEEIDRFFDAGHQFLGLDDEVKSQYGFIPDRYVGWRSKTDLELVTGVFPGPLDKELC